MLDLLQDLRKKVVIGFVGGSNLVKQIEQLSVRGHDSELLACLSRLQGGIPGTSADD